MKLKNKVTIILFSLWCVVMLTSQLGSYLILNKSYIELEQKQADIGMSRVEEAIEQQVSALKSVLASWAVWDDAYLFVINLNEAFIKVNMLPATLAAVDIDDMIFYDVNGNIKYKMAVDSKRINVIPVNEELIQVVQPSVEKLSQPGSDGKFSGLINTSKGIMLVVATPIMPSSNIGVKHGTLLMAKYLTKNIIDQLKTLTKVKFTITAVTNFDASEKKLYEALLKNRLIIDRNSETSLNGYSLVNDIYEKPVAMINATMPRVVYEFGNKTVNYYNFVFVVYSILLMLVLWYLLQILLVKRLERLQLEIGDVNDNNNSFNNLIAGIADEVTSVAKLYHQATHDALTGLANRNLLEHAFNQATQQSKKQKIALLFIDLDYFKRANDSLGHEVGDQLLIEVSKTFNECIKDNDLAVRLGGDEFVLMLVDVGVQQAIELADQIFHELKKPFHVKGHELSISCTIGVSVYPDDGKDIATLLNKADIALYHAKGNGRNHCQVYSEELNLAIQEAYKREAELQRAIDKKELVLYYQPIYDVVTRRIISVEALIRWRHPQRGFLGADQIIPIAEKSGLILPIGEWVLNTACKQAKTWQEQGITFIPIAINISILQTKSTSIYKLVKEALETHQIKPECLELELTETSYVEITSNILEDMRLLKEMGVKLVVDDFGVGYSGLGYLRSLPISKLKIDRSFIKDVLSDADDRAITLAVIAIAHQLDLQVIAEGVETIAHFEFLRLHHVDAAQGNYLCKPLDADQCASFLKSDLGKVTS